jgi:hypothetical protein
VVTVPPARQHRGIVEQGGPDVPGEVIQKPVQDGIRALAA